MLTRGNTGLIVVDMQGTLAKIVHDSELLIANSAKLIQGAQALDLPILWLEQNPEKLGATVSELSDVLISSTPISKYTFNACDERAFIQAVHKSNIDNWLLCGIETHICIYQTALGLMTLGCDVEVVSDCVSSRTVLNKELAISKLMAKGVAITSVEMCLFELVGDCRDAAFKKILSLIK